MNMKNIFFAIVFGGLALSLSAQNDVQLSQQLFSRITFNPAATGMSNYMNVCLIAREQWAAFEEAPATQVLNIHNNFADKKFGLGLVVINDKLGYEQNLNAKLNYAYHIYLGNSFLSMGLGAGIMSKSIDGAGLIYEDPNEPYPALDETKIKPDFDFGLEYNTRRLTIGASVTHLNQNYKDATNYKIPRHIYAYARYKIPLSAEFELIPTVSFNNSYTVNIVELNGLLMYKKILWAGGSYRIDESAVAMAGLRLFKGLYIGYSYDFNAAPLRNHSEGSHEILLCAKFRVFGSDYHRRSPRFFD